MINFRTLRSLGLTALTALTLVSCVPGTGSPTIDRAINRAVDTAVDRTVHRVVDGVVNRLVGRFIDTLIDRVFGCMVAAAFGAVSVQFAPACLLDVTSGSYSVGIGGAGPVSGNFTAQPFTAGADTDFENINMAFGVRGQDEAGLRFSGVGLIGATGSPMPWSLFLAEGDDPDEGHVQIASFVMDDGTPDSAAWQGPFSWNLSVNSLDRMAGTFTAPALVSETQPGTMSIQGSFDVNINASGTLILRGLIDCALPEQLMPHCSARPNESGAAA